MDQREFLEQTPEIPTELYDPARRRRRGHRSRKGHLNAGLRAYLARKRAAKAGALYHPRRHRHRRHRAYDPARRRRRARMPGFRRRRRHSRRASLRMPKFFDPSRRRRRYDFGTRGGWTSALTQPAPTMLGGQFHNLLTQKFGLGSKVYSLFGFAGVTQVGLLAYVLQVLDKKMNWFHFGPNTLEFLNGMVSEGFNVPMVENIVRQGGGSGPQGMGTPMPPVGSQYASNSGGIGQAVGQQISNPFAALVSNTPAGSAISPSYVPAAAYT